MKTTINQNIYKQMQRLAEVTKKCIREGNMVRAEKCFAVAEKLFETGSSVVKGAVANVFVFSVSSFMELQHCNIKCFFPKSLEREYIKQINKSYP